ncbi:tRNA (adenosine(37)-N6)-threonylcarbamoyltransferase complex dimerization subunit type 1 TsaB [Microbulbifer thermotolerans]|uniref:tRNA threonylcarbamoyladenosine biosynthesis protein TsaB n=1 Tax=Microbulbifer thermotolerans TaxID=252514 RepID=A0A143HS48_MICTH|nr:tRNA (adenosine(37)-N6)-threonylcarbamoyltransferase complex dimerization subunit type 1 TsaB [Microbulbifer thermotolerans]AMX04102.1 tRNA threonylcarbamoyladenosine biosynthesis protein TsaB [Microbulbifer thermotolerans]MCX2778734.1 tRNA (adenosine(37)-N6)-threonylcarbamoyltransferase complex dimerization subunit type 1 TsaB [Microbulbifer thermotolerans]MCX2793620.1 tRNA (adenosine(37)-N6)-threonylcarbamoyltransferase complex dimerization subunit type 1 TsaB [Microbulbifer thermotolerans]
MKILALDTTSGACSVALHCDGHTSEQFVRAERDHTRRILPMIDQVLGEAGVSLSQLDALAVGRGPGSFTGLRIAISCTQGLAFAADKPVLPVSSLAALAAGVRREQPHWDAAPIVAALDARMQQVYWGVYTADAPNASLWPEAVQDPQQMAQRLAQSSLPTPVYGAGAGWHYPELAQVPVAEVLVEAEIHARDIAELALPLWQSGAAVAAEDLEPLYLRDEVAWQKRQKIRSK